MAPNEIRVRVSHGSPLGDVMKDVRTWLDSQKIQPSKFTTAADAKGYLMTLAFRDEHEAERFRLQFRVLNVEDGPLKSA
jgi:hypothetical protein